MFITHNPYFSHFVGDYEFSVQGDCDNVVYSDHDHKQHTGLKVVLNGIDFFSDQLSAQEFREMCKHMYPNSHSPRVVLRFTKSFLSDEELDALPKPERTAQEIWDKIIRDRKELRDTKAHYSTISVLFHPQSVDLPTPWRPELPQKNTGPIELSADQVAAGEAIRKWLDDPHPDSRYFKLVGYAGTGKTTIIRHILEPEDRAIYATPTHKAAGVLRGSLGLTVHTLHRLCCGAPLEIPRVSKNGGLILDDDGKPVVDIKFVYNPDERLFSIVKLLVVDEFSMCSPELVGFVQMVAAQFGLRVLVVGDDGQLPPVIVDLDPDADADVAGFAHIPVGAKLEQVHRQGAQSPVLQAATLVRTQGVDALTGAGFFGASEIRHVRVGEWGGTYRNECLWQGYNHTTARDIASHDVTIVYSNKARRTLNAMYRWHVLGITSPFPAIGEKMVSNASNPAFPNGSVGCVANAPIEVTKISRTNGSKVGEPRGLAYHLKLQIVTADGKHAVAWGRLCNTSMRDRKPGDPERTFEDKYSMAFAYAMTCHKMQGGQENSVLIVDQSRGTGRGAYDPPDMPQRWLYTAITRASERVTIIRPTSPVFRH